MAVAQTERLRINPDGNGQQRRIDTLFGDSLLRLMTNSASRRPIDDGSLRLEEQRIARLRRNEKLI